MKTEELTDPSGLITLVQVGALFPELYCQDVCGGGWCKCMVYKTFHPSLIFSIILLCMSYR